MTTVATIYQDNNNSGAVSAELKNDVLSSVRHIFGTLLLVLLSCVITTALFLLYTRRRGSKGGSCPFTVCAGDAKRWVSTP